MKKIFSQKQKWQINSIANNTLLLDLYQKEMSMVLKTKKIDTILI